jgi:hypothetical protein
MTRTRTGDLPVILHSYQQIAVIAATAIGKTDYGLNELCVREPAGPLSLELDEGGFAAEDESADSVRAHHRSNPSL